MTRYVSIPAMHLNNSIFVIDSRTQLNLEKKIDELFMMKTKGHIPPRTEVCIHR